ncbi:helix-turn-helix domain-containing protein [Pedobacter aquatilis]|uniref:helix-turn-helix domain-containing protein n=1 Tax=Pedobacter aquatilis TaxID=351343 RepID=UPI00292EAE10|nr:helix-turn-helix domain-containing protein [Pedobacter aquatilis]
MKKLDTLIKILYNIYLILKKNQDNFYLSAIAQSDEEPMTRQEVKDYLKISESTYKRKVKDGTLKPAKLPGGHRYYKRDLIGALNESHNRGRL